MRPLTNLLKESGITPNETYAKYLSLLAGLGTLYFLSAVTNYLLNRLMLETSTVIMRELRAELFARMQKLPISYFDANTNGSLMSYYTNDIEATNELLQHSITQMLISVTSLTGTIAMMLVLSMRLFAIMVVLGAIVLLVVRITTKISSHSYRAQQKNAAAVNGYIEEMIAGQRDIKVFTHEKQVMADFEPINEALYSASTTGNDGHVRRRPDPEQPVAHVLCHHLRRRHTVADRRGHRRYPYHVPAVHPHIRRPSQPDRRPVQLHHAGAGRCGAHFRRAGHPAEIDEGSVTLAREGRDFYWVKPDGTHVPAEGRRPLLQRRLLL